MLIAPMQAAGVYCKCCFHPNVVWHVTQTTFKQSTVLCYSAALGGPLATIVALHRAALNAWSLTFGLAVARNLPAADPAGCHGRRNCVILACVAAASAGSLVERSPICIWRAELEPQKAQRCIHSHWGRWQVCDITGCKNRQCHNKA